jgi:hypothetical protein
LRNINLRPRSDTQKVLITEGFGGLYQKARQMVIPPSPGLFLMQRQECWSGQPALLPDCHLVSLTGLSPGLGIRATSNIDPKLYDFAFASSPVRFQSQSLTSFIQVATSVYTSNLVLSFMVNDWSLTVTFVHFH